jgi:phosphate acetyltransferase
MIRKAEVSRLRDTDNQDKYERLLAATRGLEPLSTAVAYPCEEGVLQAVVDGAQARLIAPILVGPEERIRSLANKAGINVAQFEIVDAPHSNVAAEAAVELVRKGRAELLMKGSLHSEEILGAVTRRDTGLRTGRRISHVFVMDVPTHPDTLFITDAAVNISPDLMAKRDIVQNAIDFYAGLGLGVPKVAILSAVEKVNPDIPSTIEAAALCKMADRGQINGGILDGPLAFDIAVSPEAVRIKGIESPVAGHAQVLVVPDLEAGNMLAKNLTFLTKADAAGVVLGARVPIILTSRADNRRTRIASCAAAMLLAHNRRATAPVRS